MFFLFAEANAQIIFGKITDSAGLGIEYATVALLHPSDSLVVHSALTDSKGEYLFNDVAIGRYLLKTFVIGFEQNFRAVEIDSATTVFSDIVLKTGNINLNEVTVSTLKKLIEFKNGNVIVNIEDNPFATGNSVFDLLTKLPGVTVDENNSISLQGKSGVKIVVDDRTQQMSGKQLINFLKSMNASSVSKIEILKNPPVKMQASGTGGIINIKTKKATIYGLCGSVDYTYSQGYFGMHNGSVALNYRGDKIIFYSSFNAETGNMYHDHYFNKKVITDTATTTMKQHMAYITGGKFFGGRIGLDWLVNSKNTIGLEVSTDGGTGIEQTDGLNNISNNDMGFTKLKFNSYIINPWLYSNYNLFVEHKIDTIGSNLLFTADYSPNYDLYNGDYKNWFLDTNNVETLQPFYYTNTNELTNNIFSSKIDYTQKLKNNIILEAGAKGTVAKMYSNYNFKNRNNATGEYIIDSLYSNSFTYNEEVIAGYFNLTKQWKGISLQAGLRAENTHVAAKNYNSSFHYIRDYFNLFPVVNFGYSKSESHNWQLSYNRRIDRPYYASFNPYLNRISVFQSLKGNPNLVPEYSNSFEFSHTFKGVFSNSISYAIIDHYLLDMTLQNDSSRETTAFIENLNKANRIAYSVFLSTALKKWWSININGSASYLLCEGKLAGQDYKSSGYFYMATLTNEFLVKATKLELNARYIGPRFNGIWNNGPRWGIYLAVKKSFLNNKLNVIMAIDDIFFTMIGSNSIQALNQNWKITATNDSRRLVISLNYNFGKIKVDERKLSSNEEEKNRLGK